MTLVGHSLTGAALGALVIPRAWRPRAKARAFCAFAALANGPDWPLPFWGHSQYLVSHSLFVNLALVAGLMLLAAAAARARRALGGWPVLAAGSAAWLSHLLLDSFYSHGNGVRIFWPLSLDALVLPVPWFHVFYIGITPRAALRIFAIEGACYGPLLAFALLWRARRQRAAGQTAPPSHPSD